MTVILKVDNVTKRFGGLVAVNSFSFELKEGAIDSIIGPNGAGKTTLFNCITGFYKSDEGDINFNGHHLQGLTPDRVTQFGIARTYQGRSCRPGVLGRGEADRTAETTWHTVYLRRRRALSQGGSGLPAAVSLRRIVPD